MIYLKICYNGTHLIHEQVAANTLGSMFNPPEELPCRMSEWLRLQDQLRENAEQAVIFTYDNFTGCSV